MTLRQITAIYPYENDLFVVEGDAHILDGLADRVTFARPGPHGGPLRIAVNSYRATQPPFKNLKVIWRSKRSIREMLAATPKL